MDEIKHYMACFVETGRYVRLSDAELHGYLWDTDDKLVFLSLEAARAACHEVTRLWEGAGLKAPVMAIMVVGYQGVVHNPLLYTGGLIFSDRLEDEVMSYERLEQDIKEAFRFDRHSLSGFLALHGIKA